MNKLLLTLFLAFISSHALAIDPLTNCKDMRNAQVEYQRCLDREIATLEDQITLWENNQLFDLEAFAKSTGRKDALLIFKKSQTAFANFVEQHCRWQYVYLLPDTNAAARKYKECMVTMYSHRVTELKGLATPTNGVN